MDPLSVTASIIAILTATGALLKALEQVRSRLNPNDELLLLMNSVTDLQATLITARDCADDLETNPAPAAQRSYQELRGSVCRLQESLDRLVDFAWAKLLKNGKGLSFLSLTDGKKKRLLELRESITGAHRNLQTVLLSANLRFTPSLYSAVQEAVIIENDHYTKTSAKLEQIITQITSMQSTYHNKPTNSNSTKEVHGSQNSAVQTSIVQQASTEIHTSIVSQQVRITTLIPLKQCEPSCICQCHVRTPYQTPRWLSAVVGTLFYSSTNSPALEVRPCNLKKCYRSQTSSSVHLTYYFPTWMMCTALVYSTWSNLNGTNSSWMIRIPRIILDMNQILLRIWHGREDNIKQLLQRREISPWDVDPDGASMLQMASTHSQLGICSLLVAAGADWQYKNRDGWCAADAVWMNILKSGPTDSQTIKLRELIGSEDCYDLQLSSIHRIILGLSSVDIQDQLDLDPSLINQGDWVGMSPLMWAAARDNAIAVQILVSNSANVHLKNREQKTALHFAARSGSYECVKLLLDAGADPNAYDESSFTPLHDAGRLILPLSNVEKTISMLRDYGANLNVYDSFGYPLIIHTVMSHNAKGIEALVRCGYNPNILIDGLGTALSLAVVLGEHECVKTLLKLGAHLSWITNSQEIGNIFNYAAWFATAEIMNILATSKAQAVPYNRKEVMTWFADRDPMEISQLTGQTVIPPREVDLAALEKLLAKKGIEIDPWIERPVELDNSTGESETNAEHTNKTDDYDDANNSDDTDDAGDFEDAVEDFVYPERVDSIQAVQTLSLRPTAKIRYPEGRTQI